MLRRCMSRMKYFPTRVMKNAGKDTELEYPPPLPNEGVEFPPPLPYVKIPPLLPAGKRFDEIIESWPSVWTVSQWNQAKAAIQTADPILRSTMQSACKNNNVALFKMLCSSKGAFRDDPLPAGPQTPGKYFEQRVGALGRSSITFPWQDGTQKTKSFFVCSSKEEDRFNKRKVLPDGWVTKPLTYALVSDGTGEFSDSKVTVLAGESGSGKTMRALMSSPYGVYITASDIPGDVLGHIHSLTEDNEKDERDAAVVEAVTAAVNKLINGIFEKDAWLTVDKAVFSIVLDEFGSHPVFIRGLCAARDKIRSNLASTFAIRELELRLTVVGTGTDVKDNEVGSYPDSFVALAMHNSPPMLEMLTAAIGEKFENTFASLLVQALKEHTQATYLICNPRFAALLFVRIVEFHEGGYCVGGYQPFTNLEQMLTCLDAHIVRVASDFHQRNGMAKKDRKGVEDCYMLALSLLSRPVGDVTKLSDAQLQLFTKTGVLTDDARWHYSAEAVMPEGYVRVGDIKYRDTDNRQVILIAPKVGRFRMSMAQQLLFRMAYGFGVLESAASWNRYEVVVAEYGSIVLAGHKGRKLRDIMARFGYKSDNATGEPAAFDQIVNYDSVAVVHSKHQLHPEYTNKNGKRVGATTLDMVTELQTKYTKNEAVVIVNAAGAPYADVIVLIPNVAVILIQCKYYAESTKLPKLTAEAAKMKEVVALSMITNLPRHSKTPPYFRVLATNKQVRPEELKGTGFAHLNTSDPTALAPLFTPIHVTPVCNDVGVFREVRAFKEIYPRSDLTNVTGSYSAQPMKHNKTKQKK